MAVVATEKTAVVVSVTGMDRPDYDTLPDRYPSGRYKDNQISVDKGTSVSLTSWFTVSIKEAGITVNFFALKEE